VTYIQRRKLKRKLSKLKHMSPGGLINDAGQSVPIETTLYEALLSIFVTDVLAFVLSAAGAILHLVDPPTQISVCSYTLLL